MKQESSSQKQPVLHRGPGSLLVGALYPVKALGLFVTVPRLRRYILLPILLNLVIGMTLYATLLFAGLGAIDTLLTSIPTWISQATHPPVNGVGDGLSWTSALPHWTWPNWQLPWLHWGFTRPDWIPPLPSLPEIHWPQMRLPQLPAWVAELSEIGLAAFIWVLRFVLIVLLLLLTGFILLQFGVLLGAPWYGQLSEELEKLKTGQIQTIHINPVWEIWRAVLYELKKLTLTIGLGTVLLLISFFPGGTAIAAVGWIILAATIVCLDFLDSALERRRLRFRQKLGVIQHNLPASGSFAMVCLGLVSIPFVNLLAIPICVAAGTLFVCDRVLPDLSLDMLHDQKD